MLKAWFGGIDSVSEAAANYVRRAVYDYVQAARFDDALDALERARDVSLGVNEERDIAVYVYDASAGARIKASEWGRAADTYARGLTRFPSESLFKTNLAFLAQQWINAAYASGGLEAAIAVRKQLVDTFPGNNDVVEAMRNPIRSAIHDRVKDGKYKEALNLTEGSKELLGETDDHELKVDIYDAWAKKHVQAKEWEAAAKVYATALRHVGDSSLLKNNIEFVYDSWARGFIDKGEWDNAIRVYNDALNILIDNAHFKQNRAYCVQKKAGVG